MADETEASGIVTLMEPVVMTNPNLLVPRKFKDKRGKETGEPKFSAAFQFRPDSADLKSLKAAAGRVARAKWPGRDLKELAMPFKNGDELADNAKKDKKDREHYRGFVVVNARTVYEPRLSGMENGEVVDYEGDARKIAEKKFYSCVEVLAQVNMVAYDGVGNNPDGVTAYLNMVFTTNKGKKLKGKGASGATVFKGYAGTLTAENPLTGAGDDPNEF
jgi:hypothetical protein